MRISSSQMYQNAINTLLQQQAQINELSNKMSHGKKVEKPSDDPIAATKIINLKKELANIDNYLRNGEIVTEKLSLQEIHLNEITNILQRVRELHIQASNDTLSSSNRVAIQHEVKEQLQALLSIANSKDANGNYLYAGFQSQVVPYQKSANGSYIYQGDSGQRELRISSAITIPMSNTAQDIFANYKQGNGYFKVSSNAIPNVGTAVVSEAIVNDPGQYISDNYTINFVTNGQGELAYEVIGNASGLLIPTSPSISPQDAPKYIEGQAINFNGIHLKIEGEPVAGDSFLINPSEGENIFNSLHKMMDYLAAPFSSSSQKANIQNQANQVLQEIDAALANVSNIRTGLGIRLNSVETAKDLNDGLILHNKSALSALEDLDLTDAVIKLNAATAALQASQLSFTKVQNLSIFNYL